MKKKLASIALSFPLLMGAGVLAAAPAQASVEVCYEFQDETKPDVCFAEIEDESDSLVVEHETPTASGAHNFWGNLFAQLAGFVTKMFSWFTGLSS